MNSHLSVAMKTVSLSILQNMLNVLSSCSVVFTGQGVVKLLSCSTGIIAICGSLYLQVASFHDNVTRYFLSATHVQAVL